jgi:hypothetical protein
VFPRVGHLAWFRRAPEEIANRLMVNDPVQAQAVLTEAQALYQAAADRAEHAEQRAASLQTAVAIAFSFSLAGAGLLLDPTKVHGLWWPRAIAIAFALTIFALVMTAVRSLSALAKRSRPHVIGEDDFALLASPNVAHGRVLLAARYLRYYGRNQRIADHKVELMQAGAWWLRRALTGIAALVILLLCYWLFGPAPPARADHHRGRPGSWWKHADLAATDYRYQLCAHGGGLGVGLLSREASDVLVEADAANCH